MRQVSIIYVILKDSLIPLIIKRKYAERIFHRADWVFKRALASLITQVAKDHT